MIDLSAEDVAKLITAYAKATGRPAVSVTRDAFRSAHRHLPWTKVTQNRWSEAKSIAALGETPEFPTEPLPVGHRIKGVSSYVGADGVVKGQWIKTDSTAAHEAEVLASIIAKLPETAPSRRGAIKAPKDFAADLASCIVLGDGHIGLCSWAPETGANWDLKIAEEVHCAALSDLSSRGQPADTGYLIELGDWLDSDGVNNTTTAGTPQDSDTRWPLVVETGLRILVHGVDEMLRRHRRVVVDIVPGNHNRSSATLFQHYMRAYYRHEPRIEVVTDPASRHYHRFGKVLIGTTHGDGPKPGTLGAVMAAEVPELWGQTTCRRFFVGHVHHSSKPGDGLGCEVETFRTLSARSAWAAGRGYVSRRDASLITFHREWGEWGRQVCPVESIERRAA